MITNAAIAPVAATHVYSAYPYAHYPVAYYGKREAEAEPYLGYAGLGYGYAGAYGYGKSAPCVNAANFPVPCRGFY